MGDPSVTTTAVGKGLVRQYMDLYGPYGFGVAALLLIWFCIVAPTLRENRVDVSKVQEITQSQRDTASALARTAELLNGTVTRLERAAEKLEEGRR